MTRSEPSRYVPADCTDPAIAAPLAGLPGLQVFPRSQTHVAGALFFLAGTAEGRRLGVLAPAGHPALTAFAGEHSAAGEDVLLLAPMTHANAQALQASLPWLCPRPLGLRTSAGCGDRLGLATPGHVRAAEEIVRRVGPAAPAMIFAQQSIREMTRTGRSPDDVLDDATWGIFQEGWQAPTGADADHLKTLEDVDRCVAAGYSFYTVDPGDHVDSAADTDGEPALRQRFEALPWPELGISPANLVGLYAGRRYDLATGRLALDEQTVLRAAVKYGRAVAHTALVYRHLAGRLPANAFELEVSVDETATPTTQAEHVFVAAELTRLGVNWVSLAPRFVGSFEKGVDYIPPAGKGLEAFEQDFAGHAAVAQVLGPYKLSLHSGSDKFSIYGIAARHARGLLHLKTAGTSYLEALRALAGFDPPFFRELYAFAVERWPIDRASYHVSADLARVPAIEKLADAELLRVLDQFDARQVLHITYGSVVNPEHGYRDRLYAGLRQHEAEYRDVLERHFVHHLEPMAGLA